MIFSSLFLSVMEMHMKYFWWQVRGKTTQFPFDLPFGEVILRKQLHWERRLPLPDLLSAGFPLSCAGSFTPDNSKAEDLIHGRLHFKKERTEALASLWTFSVTFLTSERDHIYGRKVFQLF